MYVYNRVSLTGLPSGVALRCNNYVSLFIAVIIPRLLIEYVVLADMNDLLYSPPYRPRLQNADSVFMPPPLIGGGIKRCFCLTSLAYIVPKSRTERPRKTKIGTEVAHVTHDSDTTFKVKRSKVKVNRPLWLAVQVTT